MTDSHPDADNTPTRPVSVAELLARNGSIGSPPVTGRRRRRRGNSDAVTVAELTGEIPVIRGDETPEQLQASHPPSNGSEGAAAAPEPERPKPDTGDVAEPINWAETGPRWPESPPQPQRGTAPELSHYPRPMRKADISGAEQMSPDPLDGDAEAEVDVMDTDVRDLEPTREDAAAERSLLRRTLFGRSRRRPGDEPAGSAEGPAEGPVAGPVAGSVVGETEAGDVLVMTPPAVDDDHTDIAVDLGGAKKEPAEPLDSAVPVRIGLLRGLLVVLQSVFAVVFGAGLFIAFEALWRWNHIVALVLSVLVILGLVVAVRVVRKTEDIGSTLIAVAVGALITLGPLALLQSG